MMRDPMHMAIKNRRSAGLDLSKVMSALDAAKEEVAKVQDPEGAKDTAAVDGAEKDDLLPDADEGGEMLKGPPAPDQMKAMHASMEEGPKDLGSSGKDMDVENMMTKGHEMDDMSRAPKTLGARVRASLHAKKG